MSFSHRESLEHLMKHNCRSCNTETPESTVKQHWGFTIRYVIYCLRCGSPKKVIVDNGSNGATPVVK